MIYPIRTDIIPLLQNLVAAIEPFAIANEVNLEFHSRLKCIEFEFHPEQLIPDLSRILCRIITLTPQSFSVKIESKIIQKASKEELQICIINSGVSLAHINSIAQDNNLNVNVLNLDNQGTLFTIHLPIISQHEKKHFNIIEEKISTPIPAFYKSLKQHLKNHFASLQNLEKMASARSNKEGIFLKKLNAVILANLDREKFSVEDLGKAMALSRSQLYRRIKPLILYSPSQYIRFVRLQKAKEFMEKGEGNIGEIAFRTGFTSHSHFTRAFKEQFGFKPSQMNEFGRGNSRSLTTMNN